MQDQKVAVVTGSSTGIGFETSLTLARNGFYTYATMRKLEEKKSKPIVGGSGERKTLKIVAKYADACNLFGSVETIKRKLDVLKEHCKNVGRDYDSILKTKLDLVIDDSEEKARKRAQQFYIGIPEQQIKDREFAIYGTREDVSRQIELLEEAGIQYLMVHLEPSRELEELDTFTNGILKRLHN
jgi:alkanesulfonate monooxygenase SsuD/methylene tetrahydromethanopterin reductase-like flavin-dependent oxidoreductase (luciferase family)